jgi:hypothetical protein
MMTNRPYSNKKSAVSPSGRPSPRVVCFYCKAAAIVRCVRCGKTFCASHATVLSNQRCVHCEMQFRFRLRRFNHFAVTAGVLGAALSAAWMAVGVSWSGTATLMILVKSLAWGLASGLAFLALGKKVARRAYTSRVAFNPVVTSRLAVAPQGSSLGETLAVGKGEADAEWAASEARAAERRLNIYEPEH